MMKRLLMCLLLLFFVPLAAQAHDVVLKNGKVVKGKLVSEDETLIVLQDSDGLRINIKKANVDVEKTKAANPPEKTSPPPEPEKPTQSAPTKEPPKPAAKKPAKKLTEEDLERLREKYDLGEGTFGEEAEQTQETEEELNEEDSYSEQSQKNWQIESEKHRERLKMAEARYNSLSEQCEKLKQIAVQTHILVDKDGNELQMQETREKVCEMAESARVQLEQEQNNLSEFMSEAKEKAIPPGWLRDQEGNEPDQQ